MAAAASKSASNGPRPRILRIGVILGGNIVEERLIRGRETITIGQSGKNTFSVPIEGLPRQWPLFTIHEGGYQLEFSDEMDGRISDGKGVHTLAQLKSRGAHKKGAAWSIALNEHARGKIVLGEMTLLFQFVTAPPLQPRPRLPASVRGTLADRIDPQLAIIMALSVLLHFGIAIYAYQRDQAVQTKIDQLHGQFQEESFKERTVSLKEFEVPQEGAATVGEAPAEEAPKEETKGDNKPKGEKREPKEEPGGGEDAAPDDAAIREKIANTAFMKIATGGAGEGGRYEKMSNTDQGAGLDKAIENVKKSGGDVSTLGRGGEGDRRSRGPQSGEVGTGKGPQVTGVGDGDTTVAVKEEEKIKSRVNLGSAVDLEDTTLDPEAVARRIRGQYLQGIKNCHQRVLKADPSAGGRVNIRFTVGPTGNVTDSSVKGFDPTVDQCILGLTKRWRFGAPKDDSGKPTSATFQIPLLLKPGE